jgi:hypothetical protein
MGWNALADQAETTFGFTRLWAGRRRKTMTQATVKKVETLVRMTRKYSKRVRNAKGEKSPFSLSAAKYYPALKKLAEK